jgi:hypothetical protein
VKPAWWPADFRAELSADQFRLGREPLGDAMRRLLTAADADARRIVIREIGSTWALRLDATR